MKKEKTNPLFKKSISKLVLLVFLSQLFWSPVARAETKIKEKPEITANNIVAQQYIFIEDGKAEQSIQDTAQKMLRAAGHSEILITVKIINDPTPNVFSISDGHIYITSGLLDVLENQDELAAILSHEIAHIIQKDFLNKFKTIKRNRTIAFTIIMIIAIGAQVGGAIAAAQASAAATQSAMQAGNFSGAASAGQMAALPMQIGSQVFSNTLLTTGANIAYAKPQLLLKEMSLQDKFAALSQQREKALQEGKLEAAARLNQDLEQLKKEKEEFIKQLNIENPEYAAFRYPQPLGLSEILLSPSEVLLKFEVTENAVLVWLIRGKEVVSTYRISITRDELYKLVYEFRNSFKLIDGIRLSPYQYEAGQRLFNLLLKEPFAKLQGEEVIISPDECLEILPYEALPYQASGITSQEKDETEIEFVGDHHSIRYCYSASVLSTDRKAKKSEQSTKTLLVLADPEFLPPAVDKEDESKSQIQRLARNEAELNFIFEPLPKTAIMADYLNRLYPEADILKGAEASEASLRNKGMQDYRYLVFATHGILDNDIPIIKEPALVLTQVGTDLNDPSRDGFLTMSEVMGMKLNCQIAALTACQTGMGKILAGEGVMGMGRAFQYAGSKSVLVSLWSVEDESTNLLTKQFFAYLKEGKDSVEALRLARLDLRKAGYTHPFYWAPFILVGEK
jgi:CHAT domain-containing protein